MATHIYRKITELVLEAADLAESIGISNLLQSGLVKEMIMADLLGHELMHGKRDADARDFKDHNIVYEYLSCKEGGTGQFDRMFKSPPDKRQESLNRIRRNSKIYLAIFYKHNQAQVKAIYELEPEIVVKETERKLDRSGNNISHVGFTEKWAQANGTIIYQREIK